MGAVRGFDNAEQQRRFARDNEARQQRWPDTHAGDADDSRVRERSDRRSSQGDGMPDADRGAFRGGRGHLPAGRAAHSTSRSSNDDGVEGMRSGSSSAMMKLSIALAERPITPDCADHIVLLFNRQYLACADDPFPPVRPRFGPNSTIVPPKRMRRSRHPVSTDRAARRSLEGVVRARRPHQPHGMRRQRRDDAQRQPAARSRRDPGRVHREILRRLCIDGQPVETIMTYTVNFRLALSYRWPRRR